MNPEGHFGSFGGRYVPEVLVPIMDDLRDVFFETIEDASFVNQLRGFHKNYLGRPTPLSHCKNLSQKVGGAQIFMKNEGLLHTGAHKINHCIGQALIARRMGKKRVIAETGAGQHGLATATVCAKFGLDCTVYMGAKDYARQRPNVFWMEQLGAQVIPVKEGDQTLRDAINAALRDLIANPEETHYLLGTVCGPNPYPAMNTWFQKIIGEEVREQIIEQTGGLPDYLVACVGGGSNALGLFYDFFDDPGVNMIGVEAGGKGIDGLEHAARFQGGSVGVAEGFKSYFLQNKDGQLSSTHSISAGLDYAGVGPQIAYLKETGRVKFGYAVDEEVLTAYKLLAQTEGVFAALESSHAVVEVIKLASTLSVEKTIVFNCSGRGDKDLFIVTNALNDQGFRAFLGDQVTD
ncbi:MAG: tryptophan synthase subunit beta [Candidatus Marinimicrobia bacterium]|nr:tryptophan synthase subunit beta [Candidatus Neomarinimicrobiota bacterium]